MKVVHKSDDSDKPKKDSKLKQIYENLLELEKLIKRSTDPDQGDKEEDS